MKAYGFCVDAARWYYAMAREFPNYGDYMVKGAKWAEKAQQYRIAYMEDNYNA